MEDLLLSTMFFSFISLENSQALVYHYCGRYERDTSIGSDTPRIHDIANEN